MDQELLIIELLSAAEPIYRQAQKNRHQNLISAFLYIVAVCVVFFVIGSFAYQHLHGQGGTTDSNYWLHGSAVLGILIAVLAVFLFSINLIQGIVLRRSFQRFLVRCVQKTERYPIIYQDDDSYYRKNDTGRRTSCPDQCQQFSLDRISLLVGLYQSE